MTVLVLGFLLFVMLLSASSPAFAGPQYRSAVELYHGPTAPVGIAVDSSGTVYWTNYDTGQLLSLSKRAATPSILLSGLNHPQGVAVDASGNIYFDEYFAYTISELTPGSSTPKLLFNATTYTLFMSVDLQGNIYVVTGAGCNGQTSNANVPDSILMWNKTSGSISTKVSDSGIGGVFVTPSNDLYYTTCGGAIKELLPGSSTPGTIISGLSPSTGVAVDSANDVFFTQYSSGVYELNPGSSVPITLTTASGTHYGLTIDNTGNLYYTDNLGGGIWEVPVSATSTSTSAASTSSSTTSLTAVNKLWTYDTGSPVYSLKVSGDGRFVLVGTDSGSAFLFSSTGTLIEEFNPPASSSATGDKVVNVGLTYNASGIIATKTLYNIFGGLVHTFSAGPGGYTVSVSPNGSDFVTSSDSGVSLFTTDGRVFTSVWSQSYTHGVEEVRASISPDARSIIVESQDTQLSILSAANGLPSASLTLNSPIVGFDSSYNASLNVVSTADGIVRYLDGSGNVVRSFAVPDTQVSVVSVPQWPSLSYLAQNVAVPWAGNYVIIGDSAGTVNLFDGSGLELASVSVSSLPVQEVAASANGEYFAAGSSNIVYFMSVPSLVSQVQAPHVQSYSTASTSSSSTGSTSSTQSTGRTTVSFAIGDVTLQYSDGTYSHASSGMLVGTGTVIVVGSSGLAAVQFPDGSQVATNSGSSVALTNDVESASNCDARSTLSLSQGEFWVSLVCGFVIDTPSAILNGSSDQFLVQVAANGSTNIKVFQGSVHVQAKASLSTASVGSNSQVTVGLGSSTPLANSVGSFDPNSVTNWWSQTSSPGNQSTPWLEWVAVVGVLVAAGIGMLYLREHRSHGKKPRNESK